MTEQKIAMLIAEKSKEIARLLSRGKDVELRKDVGGIKIISVDKKVMR